MLIRLTQESAAAMVDPDGCSMGRMLLDTWVRVGRGDGRSNSANDAGRVRQPLHYGRSVCGVLVQDPLARRVRISSVWYDQRIPSERAQNGRVRWAIVSLPMQCDGRDRHARDQAGPSHVVLGSVLGVDVDSWNIDCAVPARNGYRSLRDRLQYTSQTSSGARGSWSRSPD
jgi:hypothetical protein